ncbi:MAG: acetate--CoA ligase family protein, partial [Halobacteria archaeon]|nr:acetate--CoA ligase family protein [Halobacteria archaeon]
PVVLKVDSPDVPHRSDAGAVITNIQNEQGAREAYDEILENVRGYDENARVNGVLVQPLVRDGFEAIVGVSH